MKILVIFTGGTISCSSSNGVLSTDESNSYRLIELYSAIDNSVEFDLLHPYTILSENLSGDNLNELYACLKSQNLSEYDGVIVTHGTDTLQYTSAFLGYAFSKSKTPIVLVSANYPLDDERSNGLDNFTAAVDFLKSREGTGAFVAYKNCGEEPKIHRATRLLPHLPYSDKLFSVMDCVYGKVKNGAFEKNSAYREKSDELEFDKVKIDSCCDVVKISPCIDDLLPKLSQSTKAVLFEGYHSGTLNTSSQNIRGFCQRAESLQIPLFLTGSCEGFNYESKALFDKLKIKALPAASPIAMYIKLRLLDKSAIQDVFLPCGGDFCS
jgi:L-asparaginase